MAAPTLYRSSDASAPVLTGTAGDLINLLDKCLVNGYGAKAAAGWTRNTGFAGNSSTRAVFRQGAGNQFYLDVDDRGATSVLTGASGKEAAVRGYESMTDVSTGTAPFPTTAQIATATANWRKSATADTVPRGWFLIADDRTFYLFILTGDTANCYFNCAFGDIYSIKSGDGYRTLCQVRTAVNSASTTGLFLGGGLASSFSSTTSGHYLARIAAATGTSIILGLVTSGSGNLEVSGAFPALDNNLYLSKILISDVIATYLRGWIRGVYIINTPVGLNDGDTFTGTGDFAGRTFVVVKNLAVISSAAAIETSAWDTSS